MPRLSAYFRRYAVGILLSALSVSTLGQVDGKYLGDDQAAVINQDSENLVNIPLRPWFQFSTLGCERSDWVEDQYHNVTCLSSHPPAFMTADVEGGMCLPAIYSPNNEGMFPSQSKWGHDNTHGDTYVEIENIGPSPPPGHPERVGFLAILHTVDEPKTKYKVYFYNPQSLSLDQIRQNCFRSSPETESLKENRRPRTYSAANRILSVPPKQRLSHLKLRLGSANQLTLKQQVG